MAGINGLDLSFIMGNLALDGFQDAPESPVSLLEDDGQDRLPAATLKPAEPQREAVPELARQRQEELAEAARGREAYRKYQDNIRASEQYRAEILKGVRAGESIEPLFIKACKVISLMTAEPVFAEQIEQDVLTIYGEGQQAAAPLQLEAEQIQDRLTKMRQALQWEKDQESRRRIQAAVAAHEDRLNKLQALMQQ